MSSMDIMPDNLPKKATYTTVSLKPETKQRLISYGSYGDSVDDVVNKVLDLLEAKSKKGRR